MERFEDLSSTPSFSVTRASDGRILIHLDSAHKVECCLQIRDPNTKTNFNALSHEQEREQKRKQGMPLEILFLVALWTVIPTLILFFFVLGLGFFGVSLQIQVAVVIVGVLVLSIRTFRLYRSVRIRMLAKIKTGPEVLVGSLGMATTDLRPKGEVRVNGEFWQAMAKEGWIEKDRDVEVVGVEGSCPCRQKSKRKSGPVVRCRHHLIF